MKKLLLTAVFAAFAMGLNARVVKFSVDMAGLEVSPNGVHVTGDFQELAGFPGGDWSPNSTPLAREGQTTIYSTFVSIPAFRYYEYRFVNGDQFYETEFVPVESRIGYDFNDNRWIYVDSLANDTLDTGPILFGGNAPAGKFLLRFNLNASMLSSIHPAGIRVAGSFNNWNTAQMRLVSFDGQHWEGIVHLPAGNYTYRFVNGNTSTGLENVPSNCSAGGNRQVVLTDHTVLGAVCFGACDDCNAAGTGEAPEISWFTIKYGNGLIEVNFKDKGPFRLAIFDAGGRLLRNFSGNDQHCAISTSGLNGPLLIRMNQGRFFTTAKFVIK